MTDERIVQHLRLIMLLAAGAMFIVTPVELWLTEHFQEPVQLIPFVLCALGILTVGAVVFRPRRGSIRALRGVMILVVLGSLLGIGLHLYNNFQFELDIRPSATAGDVVMAALSGANPLLAPGILAFAALLAIAATYYHPALTRTD
ncbi:MAG: hypothetical protein KC519_18205 [Anaerolineae bacterium]|nr:hypothetical protein [Anaerolineae bacterium]